MEVLCFSGVCVCVVFKQVRQLRRMCRLMPETALCIFLSVKRLSDIKT